MLGTWTALVPAKVTKKFFFKAWPEKFKQKSSGDSRNVQQSCG
jgi:hypothetical protein